MNSLKIISNSFEVGMQQWRSAAIVYFIQWCLALTLGMQAHSVLESSIGNSLEINKLLVRYDHTVLTDFLKVHGASITPLIGQLRWLLLVWLIFSVFLNAGMLFCVTTEAKTGKAFWKGGAGYFFPFLKISLIMLLCVLVWTALVWIPMALFFEPSLQYFSAEKYTVWLVLVLLFIYLTGLAILFIWSVISRMLKIKTGAPIADCIKNAWSIFSNNKSGFVGLMLGFVVMQIILLAVYWVLEASIGMTSSGLIVMLFMVQQAFMFFRIQLRLVMYSGIGSLTITAANK